MGSNPIADIGDVAEWLKASDCRSEFINLDIAGSNPAGSTPQICDA